MKSKQRTDEEQNKVGVFDNHAFFWKSSLTQERMRQIDQWIGSLTKEQRKMLDDLLSDTRDDARWEDE